MLIQKAYKFRFYPTADQRRQLAVDFGCSRWCWNAALDARGLAYRALNQSFNAIDCSKAINELKREPDYAWLKDANSTVITQALRDQDRAFANFFQGRAGYPKFKKKLHEQSARYQLDQRHISRTFDVASQLLKLPKLGALKLRWSRAVEGIPKMVTVTQEPAGRYFVSFACEVEHRPLPPKTKAVGIDLGLTDVATLSNGEKSGNPRYLRKYARKLKLAKRVMSRRKRGSGRWHRARIRIAKLEAKIADCRRDFQHKLTTNLIKKFGVIALEDLSIKAMSRAFRLGKSVADAGLGAVKRQLQYKAEWNNRALLQIDRFARSTGVCPNTGQIGDKLALNVRRWRCNCCGVEHDRDVAAAQSILMIATAGRAGLARGAGQTPIVAAA